MLCQRFVQSAGQWCGQPVVGGSLRLRVRGLHRSGELLACRGWGCVLLMLGCCLGRLLVTHLLEGIKSCRVLPRTFAMSAVKLLGPGVVPRRALRRFVVSKAGGSWIGDAGTQVSKSGGTGSYGCWGRAAGSVSWFNVFVVPGASGSAIKACRARASSPSRVSWPGVPVGQLLVLVSAVVLQVVAVIAAGCPANVASARPIVPERRR